MTASSKHGDASASSSSSVSSSSLARRLEAALAQREKQGRLRSLTPTSSQRGLVDFSSNDYLSLSANPELRSSFLRSLQESSYGPASSRLLDGNTPAHAALEQELAAFFRSPAALLFNSGFDANVSIFTTVPGPQDYILYDAAIHASVHDGMRASRTKPANRRPFRHNSVQSLRDELQSVLAEQQGSSANILVAVESLYSMDGDLCPLKEMLDAAESIVPSREGKLHFILDEAHSTGTFGPQGRGWAAQLGVEDRLAIRLHTFGKAMASQGAVVLSSPLFRQYFINYARPLIYSTTLPLYAVAAIRSSINYLQQPSASHLQSHLHSLSQYTRHHLNLPASPAFIVPFPCREAKHLAQHIQSAGFMVRPIVWPTVEKGQERVRICLHAGNTREEVDRLLVVFKTWMRQSKL